LRELVERHQLRHLSMGTTQDYLVAVEEGATIIRLGTALYAS
jgi:PLP dependent protein